MKQLEALLAPDRSAGDWARRHGLYWLGFTLATAAAWAYWAHSFRVALVCSLVNVATLYLPVTYLLLYGVLPKLLHRQYGVFWGRALGWVAFSFGLRFVLLSGVARPWLVPAALAPYSWRGLFNATFMVTNNFVVVAAALKLFRYQYQQTRANQQLAQETLAIELKTLQAQVQPHFLFNTLNTLYSLALRQSPQAGPAVRQLAALLRYMFREGDAPEVSLAQEVELLRNYAALEQLRYGPRLTVRLCSEGELAGKQLAPLLLLPFVENAFKHGVSAQTGPARIDIDLLALADTLRVRIGNSLASLAPVQAPQPGGLGLQNVRQRLALLYPGQHTLRVRAEARRFLVELTLPLRTAPAGASMPPLPTADPSAVPALAHA